MKKGMKIAVGVIVALVLISILTADRKETNSQSNVSPTSNNNTAKVEEPSVPGLNEVLHTQYFDVIVSKVALAESVNTGNQFADLPKEPDTKYLLIKATFKNTDQESRMLTEGTVHINYKGTDYKFDHSETIMLEGWGLLLDQINPLVSKTTNLVYKLPMEIVGDAYWEPGRSDGKVIYLGPLQNN